ncbi:MAG: segregation/condensation protein A [Oscillospiraceae bacterium]|jgi:segregation and condensation protein A|nr:segregation/condensation protein A [Oscillospiraceae bacterium]
MEKLSYKLEIFEGPLDVLLFLISKNKLDIYDISVSELLEQYMLHIGAMRESDMEVASEFLIMATRLVYIKTAMLMPQKEQAEALKQELEGELIEYQLCRELAVKLSERADFDRFSREEMKIDLDKSYKHRHSVSEIYKAYLAAAGRGKRREPPSAERFEAIVAKKTVSVESKVIGILKRLYRFKTVQFAQLFDRAESKSDLVATFLALLELIKHKRIYVEDDLSIIPIADRKRK